MGLRNIYRVTKHFLLVTCLLNELNMATLQARGQKATVIFFHKATQDASQKRSPQNQIWALNLKEQLEFYSMLKLLATPILSSCRLQTLQTTQILHDFDWLFS